MSEAISNFESSRGPTLIVTKYRVAPERLDDFLERANAAVKVLLEKVGFESAYLGRSIDEHDVVVLSMTWADVGSYRRGLGGFESKMVVVPLLSEAFDEASAFEVIRSCEIKDGEATMLEFDSDIAADAGTTGPG